LTTRFWLLFIFLLNLLWGRSAGADPLGAIHVIDDGPPRVDLSFRSDLWTSPNQNKESPLRIYNLQFNFPVYRDDTWKVLLLLNTEGLRIGNAGLSVGEDKVDIGGDLRSQAVGLGVVRTQADASSDSFFGTYNSESDEPFRSGRDTGLDVAFYHKFVPDGERQWVAGFDQSKNRGIFNDRPIPLLGVIYRPSPEFTAVFGFPFLRFTWNTEPWQKQLLITPVGINAQASHRIDEFLVFYGRAGLTNRSYMHTQRIADEKRIIYEEKYVEIAALRMVSSQASLETSFGTSFNRRLYEAQRVYAPIGDVVSIKSDIYGTVKMGFQF
jgi:hypothetical protein